ncbi:MAG: DUF935 family protein [Thermodesulfobacteriota bacterium]
MEEEKNLKAQAEIDKIITVDIGLPMGKKYLYDTYGIPEPEEGEEVVEVRPQASGVGRRGEDAGGEFAEGKPFTPNQQALESLADRAISGATTALEANEKKILEALNAAENYEDAFQRVLEVYPDMDMDALTDMVERVWLNASLFARQTMEDETGG